jgi:hypothetical protein
MPQRIESPEWRDSHEPTKYPFFDEATLVNENGLLLFPDTFLDAAFYPVGGQANGYLSQVSITSTEATLWYGDDGERQRASGKLPLASPPEQLQFVDAFERPAGLLVSEEIRMAVFQSWPVGDHEFTREQTGLVAAVCMPTPELGVRGIMADDGTVLNGDVYLVGDEGIVLTCEEVEIPGDCQSPATVAHQIKVHVVGDPLWRRRECAPGFFTTPRFLQQLTFQRGAQLLQCGPGNGGNVRLLVGNTAAEDTILRIRTIDEGVLIEAVGERLENIGS